MDAGYIPQVDTFRLQFEGESYAGLEVLCMEGSVDAYDALTRTPSDPARRHEAYRLMCEMFAPQLIRWNMAHPVTGEPVPATLAGLRSLPPRVVTAVVGAWLDAVLGQVNPDGAGAPDAEAVEAGLAGLSTVAA